ncbi:MAG: class I SAM-dependent methyltransferase [Vicinamibacteria bacterium]
MSESTLRRRVGTLVGRPRRHHFLKRLPRDAVGAELGVFRGEFTRRILEIAKPRELHLIDGWWELHGETFPFEWGAYADWGKLSTRDAHAEVERIAAAAEPGVCEIHVGDDLEILERFPDRHFDWVYLDTSHQYEHTLAELELLDARVKPAGLIAGHDWIEDPASVNHGAYRAIREFCSTAGWAVEHLDGFTQWEIRRKG